MGEGREKECGEGVLGFVIGDLDGDRRRDDRRSVEKSLLEDMAPYEGFTVERRV